MTPEGPADAKHAFERSAMPAPRPSRVELAFTDDGPNVGVWPGSATHSDFLLLAGRLLGDLDACRKAGTVLKAKDRDSDSQT